MEAGLPQAMHNLGCILDAGGRMRWRGC